MKFIKILSNTYINPNRIEKIVGDTNWIDKTELTRVILDSGNHVIISKPVRDVIKEINEALKCEI